MRPWSEVGVKRARVLEKEDDRWMMGEGHDDVDEFPSAGRCLNTTQPSALGSGRLPQVILERIFSFALINLYMEITPRVRDDHSPAFHEHMSVSALRQWMPVCRYWHDVIHSVIKEHDVHTLHINLASRLEGYERLQQSVVKRGPRLLSLKISRSGYPDMNAEVQPTVDWNALFQAIPNLTRLDLTTMMYLTRPCIAHILDTVSTHCLKLQALLLPLPYPWAERSILLRRHRATYTPLLDLYDVSSIVKARCRTLCREEDVHVMKRLEVALQRWYYHGPYQGLSQLVLYQTAHVSSSCLSSVAQNAPRIELLEGWKVSYFNDGFGPPGCLQQWNMELSTWEYFCRQCKLIREFNWIIVPFSDPYFKAFGATMKEQLTQLTIDLDDQRGPWNLHETAIIPRTHTSSGFRHIVNGLPWLTYLHINLHPRLRVDLDVFDDELLKHLATTCPALQHVWISECGGYEQNDAMTKISERGLEVLGTLPCLRDLKLRVLDRVTVRGVMALIAPQMSSTLRQKQRNIKLSIGQADFKDEVVCKVLQHMGHASFHESSMVFALQLHSRWQEMVARNTAFCPTDPLSKSMLYRCRTLRLVLQPLVDHVHSQHERHANCQVVYNARVAHIVDCTVYSTQWKHEKDPHSIFLQGDMMRQGNRESDDTSWFISEPTLTDNECVAIYGRSIILPTTTFVHG